MTTHRTYLFRHRGEYTGGGGGDWRKVKGKKDRKCPNCNPVNHRTFSDAGKWLRLIKIVSVSVSGKLFSGRACIRGRGERSEAIQYWKKNSRVRTVGNGQSG